MDVHRAAETNCTHNSFNDSCARSTRWQTNAEEAVPETDFRHAVRAEYQTRPGDVKEAAGRNGDDEHASKYPTIRPTNEDMRHIAVLYHPLCIFLGARDSHPQTP